VTAPPDVAVGVPTRDHADARMSDATKVHRAMGDDSRSHIVDVLRATPDPMGIRDIADAVGLHVSTVRGHLDVLQDAGLVTSEQVVTDARGRPPLAWTATAAATTSADGGYRLLAEILLSQLVDRPASPLESGRRWGAHLIEAPRPGTVVSDDEAVQRVLALLDQLGFAPSLDDDTVRLRRCPFADLARGHEDLICQTHLGIVRGALDALGSTTRAEAMAPFVEPSLCTVRLSAS